MAEQEKVTLDTEQKEKLPELSEVVELVQGIAKKREKDIFDKEMLDKLAAKVGELTAELSRRSQERKGEFSTEDAEKMIVDSRDPMPRGKALDIIGKDMSGNPEVKAVQEVIDRTYVMCEIFHKHPTELRYFREKLDQLPLLRKALNIADVGNVGVGSALTGWQPAEFTQRMIEKVRLALRVAALHPRINMPSDPYRFPLEGTDATAYLVTEQGAQDAELTAANRVSEGLSATGADHLVMSSKKLGSRLTFSNELDEDSFIAIADYLEGKIVYSMAAAQENVTINGDPAATLDTGGGGYGTNDQRKAWKGYRKYLQGLASKVTASSATALDIKDIRSVRAKMGKYGINPSDYVIICGPVGYIKLLALADGNNPSPVTTLEKYGPNATIITGELAKVDGTPILVSEYVGPNTPSISGAENLTITGLYDGVTTSYTELLMVRPSAFLYGDRRAAQLKTREIIETDQQVMVILQRLTMLGLYPNDTVVGGVVGILK